MSASFLVATARRGKRLAVPSDHRSEEAFILGSSFLHHLEMLWDDRAVHRALVKREVLGLFCLVDVNLIHEEGNAGLALSAPIT